MKEKFTPGSVMSEPLLNALAAPPPCEHLNLVPLEFAYAKVTYPNGYNKAADYDYATTLMAANICRVSRYFCPTCKAEIKAPKRKD